MKKEIILSGVGGQGILSIASVIGLAALSQGLHIKQAEVHGMSQRGGDVQSNLRLSSDPIYSDLIGRGCADVIISLEPMEALRYLPCLSRGGWVVSNTNPLVNVTNYPDKGSIVGELESLPRAILIDADGIAAGNGGARAVNVVLLGAAAAVLGIDIKQLEEAICELFLRKGEQVIKNNIAAFRAGLAQGREQMAARP